MRKAERCRLNVFEMKCLRPVLVVTRFDSARNDDIRRREVIEKTVVEKEDRRVFFMVCARRKNGEER